MTRTAGLYLSTPYIGINDQDGDLLGRGGHGRHAGQFRIELRILFRFGFTG